MIILIVKMFTNILFIINLLSISIDCLLIFDQIQTFDFWFILSNNNTNQLKSFFFFFFFFLSLSLSLSLSLFLSLSLSFSLFILQFLLINYYFFLEQSFQPSNFLTKDL